MRMKLGFPACTCPICYDEEQGKRAAWGRPAGERDQRDREANRAHDVTIASEWERYAACTFGPLGEEAG